jgi:hypothetical protein
MMPQPRVAVFTSRTHRRELFRGLGYEYEDAIVSEFEDGLLVHPDPSVLDTRAFRLRRQADRVGLGGILPRARAGTMETDVDLFFAFPASSKDLFALAAIPDWRERSRFAVCHLQELWVANMAAQVPGLRHILNRFDHIICMLHHSVEPLAQALDVPVSYLPPSVDAEALCPYPHPPERVIDACAIGAMHPETHAALWDWDRSTGRYYRFSTDTGASFAVSHLHHRQALAQTLQRSKFFFAYRAKRDFSQERGQQEEFGPRYFEGAAAGAIVVGDRVTGSPPFEENLDWEGAVIAAEFDEPGMPAILEDLLARQDWLEGVRRANVSNCLTRHDHVHRWQSTLDLVGLSPTPEMAVRQERLKALAARVSG